MILETAQQLLESAGYEVRLGLPEHSQLFFEDASLLGLVCVCPSTDFIVGNWRLLQDSFLREAAESLRSAPEKAWNTYLILLTVERATDQRLRELAMIEEDFTAMRKIAVAGAVSPDDILHALAPLLPMRAVAVRNEKLIERLRRTLPLDVAAFEALIQNDSDLLISLLLDDK